MAKIGNDQRMFVDSEQWMFDELPPVRGSAYAAERDDVTTTNGSTRSDMRSAINAMQAAFRALMLTAYVAEDSRPKQRADAIAAHRAAVLRASRMLGGL